MRRLYAVCCLFGPLVVGACGSRGPLDDGLGQFPYDTSMYSAGKRLRPVVQVVGGVRSLVAWFDSERAEYCQFNSSAGPSRQSYCLPIPPVTGEAAPHAYPWKYGMTTANDFADDSCTQRVARGWQLTGKGGLPLYAFAETEDSCAAASAIVPILGEDLGPVYERIGGQCSLSQSRGRFLRVGPPLARSPFVQAHEVVELRPGPLDAVVLRTDDGARQVISAFDRRRGEAVRAFDGARDQRWVPIALSFGPGMAHGPTGCGGGAIATKIRNTARCPTSVAIGMDACGMTFYPVRREVSMDEVLRCGGRPDDFVFEIGPQLPEETFHEVREIVTGAGRIRSLGLSGPAGVALSHDLFDSHLGAKCSLGPTDAGLRCIPEGRASAAWLDPACSQPALTQPARPPASTPPTSECAASNMPRLLVNRGSTPSVFQAVGELRPVYTKTDTSCTPSGLGYAAVRVPNDSLAPGSYVVE